MRISGGRARGITLKTPPGDKTRPATDYMREAVFSSIGTLVNNALVLDLFAGTGAYGLEALSRGAHAVTFVEKDRRALHCLKHNADRIKKSMGNEDASNDINPVSGDVFQWSPDLTHCFDLIFVDPPYALLEEKGKAILMKSLACLKKDSSTRIILECPGHFELPAWADITLAKQIQKGKHQPSIYIIKHS